MSVRSPIASMITGLVFDWRAWAVAIIAGLAINSWALSTQLDRAVERDAARAQRVEDLTKDVSLAEAAAARAALDKAAAEEALANYSEAAIVAFQQQAEASRRMAAEVAQLKRRVDVANQEIADADPSLRLDDPLPGGLRDALACAGGDLAACAAAEADPGRVSVGTDDAPGPAAAAPADADRARGAPDRGGRPSGDRDQRQPGGRPSGVRLGVGGPAED